MAAKARQGKVTDVEIARIVRDPEIQPREEMNHDTVTQYAEDMLAGIDFPAVVVHDDGDQLWLSQGFHRCEAAEKADFATILAETRKGTRQDAMWDASGSNREHDDSGMRRSNADKRRAVMMALEARPNLSDTLIAKQVGVSVMTVGRVRPISNNVIDRPSTTQATTRDVTRNGTTYTMQTGKIGQRASTSVEAEEEDEEPEVEEEFHACHHCGMTLISRDRKYCDSCLRSGIDPKNPVSEEYDDQDSPDESEPGELFQLTPQSIEAEVKPASRPTFNATNDMVDWARWTWNPVTGCEHNCVYCYARDIANRFYPEKFTPTFRPERLEAPRFTSRPQIADADNNPVAATAWRNVFVCSMADLFGRWVPDQWIEDVFASCRRSPEWNYLFLTKFPQRYVGLDFPATAWVGTSVDEQKRVANAEKAFRKIESPVKWLSVEPMRERIVFKDLSMFHWVVIGGQSRSSEAPEFHPDPWWVMDLACRAREAGCKVYLKPNTYRDKGWQIKEYPY